MRNCRWFCHSFLLFFVATQSALLSAHFTVLLYVSTQQLSVKLTSIDFKSNIIGDFSTFSKVFEMYSSNLKHNKATETTNNYIKGVIISIRIASLWLVENKIYLIQPWLTIYVAMIILDSCIMSLSMSC